MKLPTESRFCLLIKCSRLSVGGLLGGFGALSVGGGPGDRPSVVRLRVSDCLWMDFNRCEVDLKIVDRWFSDVDRWVFGLAGATAGAYGSVEEGTELRSSSEMEAFEEALEEVLEIDCFEALLFGHLEALELGDGGSSYPGGATTLGVILC
jgi:hypothetical protein